MRKKNGRNSSKGSKIVPNIQEEVPFKRIALLRVRAKTHFLRFGRSTQVDEFEKFFGWVMGFTSTNNRGKSPLGGSRGMWEGK